MPSSRSSYYRQLVVIASLQSFRHCPSAHSVPLHFTTTGGSLFPSPPSSVLPSNNRVFSAVCFPASVNWSNP
ncbi:Protein of unknown function [Pyronema omphalodes CBS 100304]|uniref:Uncharacterized protein n=1 Tax=Pyronema omphalodes (strain CBS 100304) TaxID=1076935 RepID=U4KV80_PYROM|nr:Protein of unknown function [Pyronema omphalodes CBS 100304]